MTDKNKIIIPRGNYVLVKPTEPKEDKEDSESGLIIPDNIEEEQKSQGEVLRIPEYATGDISNIKVGDIIVYGAFAGEDIEIMEGGEKVKYKLIHDEDIIAFIK